MAQLSDDCFAFGGELMRADEALALMVAQPLLIHRPLMEANDKLGSGFGSATDLGLLQTQDMPCVGPGGCAQHPDHQH